MDRSTTGGKREKDNLDGRALSGSGILSWRMSYTDSKTRMGMAMLWRLGAWRTRALILVLVLVLVPVVDPGRFLCSPGSRSCPC